MSRGPGRIERAIRDLFAAHPDLAFITDELCEHCYPGACPIERKHQVFEWVRAGPGFRRNRPVNWERAYIADRAQLLARLGRFFGLSYVLKITCKGSGRWKGVYCSEQPQGAA